MKRLNRLAGLLLGVTVLAGSGQPALAQAEALISALTSGLGVTETQAIGGSAAIFGLAQERLSPEEFASLSDSVPGVSELAGQAPAMTGEEMPSAETPSAEMPSAEMPSAEMPSEEMPSAEMPSDEMPSAEMPSAEMPSAADAASGVAGMTGGLGDVGGAMGDVTGDLGGLASLAGPFSDLGMSPDMAAEFVPVVLDYVSNTGGSSAMSLLQGALLGG